MQKQYIPNRRLHIINKKNQDKLLSLKIKRAKSALDINCPESFTFYKTTFKDSHRKNRCI